MPYKGTKALEAVKPTTVISTYTTGVPIAPAAGHLSIYIDLVDTILYRKLEILNRIRELVNRAREENYRRPAGTTCYYIVNLDLDKSQIIFTTTLLDISNGEVAIGIHADVLTGSRGSVLLDACFKEIMQVVQEALKTI